jgi:hypothetical protein
MAPLYFLCGSIHAVLRSYVDLNEFDGKAMCPKLCRSLFSALAVASAHQYRDSSRAELPRDLSSDSFIRTRHQRNFIGHKKSLC